MKEIMRQTHVLREGLTSQAQEAYSKGGDIYMAGEPGQGETEQQQPTGQTTGTSGGEINPSPPPLEPQTAGAGREGEVRPPAQPTGEPIEEPEKPLHSGSPDGTDKRQEIMRTLRKLSPHTASLQPELIEEVIKDDVTLEYLINRIIAQPLDAETSEYKLSFYGGINLEQIKDILKAKAETNSDAKNKYQRTLLTSEAVALFHTMNLQIITGNLEQFVSGARSITPEQLQIMQGIPGVAQVMRLFDEEMLRFLSKNTIIDGKVNDELTGIARDPKNISKIVGKKEGGGIVEQRLKELIDSKAAEELTGLEGWQKEWAFNVGKIMHNLTLRAAEVISLSKVPDGDKKYASIPQESAARLMNWLGWTGLRFGIAEPRGGVRLTKMTSQAYQRLREAQGYGKVSIENIGWQKVEDFELAGIFNVTGVWSSWRQNLIILENAPTPARKTENNEEKIKTIRDFFEELNTWEKNRKKELIAEGYKGTPLNEKLQEEKAAQFRKTFLIEDESKRDPKDPNKAPEFILKRYFNNSLGLLLKHNAISVSEKDLQGLREVKEKIRKAIWLRVAEDNPLAIAPFLHGLIKGKDEDPFLLTDDGTKKTETTYWDSLTKKLIFLHELRMQRIRIGEDIALDALIESEEKKENGIRITSGEKSILDKIRKEGKNFAGDFANIRFPNNPFMNDVIFEKAAYGGAGAEFYRRRAGGDLPSFYSAGTEFGKLMDNPGAMPPEKALNEVLLAVVQAVGSPLGTDAGQDRIAPFLEAYLTFISKGGQLGVNDDGEIKTGFSWEFRRWLAKDSIYAGIMKVLRKKTSLAQQYAGPEAASVDEYGMLAFLDSMLHHGVTRRLQKDKDGIVTFTDLDEKFRKKFKVKLGWLLLAFFRDVIPIFAVGALVDFGQKTAKEKA